MGQHAYPPQPYAAFPPYAHPMHTHNWYAGQPPVQPHATPLLAPQQSNPPQPKGNYVGQFRKLRNLGPEQDRKFLEIKGRPELGPTKF